MEIFNFNEIRKLLLDSTNEGIKKREEVSRAAAHTKALSGLAGGVTGMLGLISLITAVTSPFFGGLGLLFWGVATLTCREIFVISGNVENALSGSGFFGNILSRGVNALTPKIFIESIFKNTWIAGPFFSASIIKELERKQT